jgi:hypothetical protein
MREDEALEAPSQTFPRASIHVECRGAGRDDVNSQAAAARAVPSSFQAVCPVGQMLDLVEQQDRGVRAGDPLRLVPHPLPEAWQRGFRPVHGGVDGSAAETLSQLEHQRCLPNLPGACQKLNAAWSGFAKAPLELGETGRIVEPELVSNHSRIIIRPYSIRLWAAVSQGSMS